MFSSDAPQNGVRIKTLPNYSLMLAADEAWEGNTSGLVKLLQKDRTLWLELITAEDGREYSLASYLVFIPAHAGHDDKTTELLYCLTKKELFPVYAQQLVLKDAILTGNRLLIEMLVGMNHLLENVEAAFKLTEMEYDVLGKMGIEVPEHLKQPRLAEVQRKVASLLADLENLVAPSDSVVQDLMVKAREFPKHSSVRQPLRVLNGNENPRQVPTQAAPNKLIGGNDDVENVFTPASSRGLRF
tara:strand:- start:237 stop:965 length:729 start_codon:yes stop_codon:yes gene_type:complete